LRIKRRLSRRFWQEEWAKFKQGLSKKTGASHQPRRCRMCVGSVKYCNVLAGKMINDLVVHRAEDYRRVVEESDIMFKVGVTCDA
jgi:hypothetical protein